MATRRSTRKRKDVEEEESAPAPVRDPSPEGPSAKKYRTRRTAVPIPKTALNGSRIARVGTVSENDAQLAKLITAAGGHFVSSNDSFDVVLAGSDTTAADLSHLGSVPVVQEQWLADSIVQNQLQPFSNYTFTPAPPAQPLHEDQDTMDKPAKRATRGRKAQQEEKQEVKQEVEQEEKQVAKKGKGKQEAKQEAKPEAKQDVKVDDSAEPVPPPAPAPFRFHYGPKHPFDLAWQQKDTLYVLDAPTFPHSSKIAAFDMDHTLVTPKNSKAKFASSRDDWVWWQPNVVNRLRQMHMEGYKVVIFSNQGGVAKGHCKAEHLTGKVLDLAKELGFPIQAFLATGKDHWSKPSPLMWYELVQQHNGDVPVSLAHSFFVGDAAGRVKNWKPKAAKDFSVSDRAFACNVGIQFFTPEEFFLGEQPGVWEFKDPSVEELMAEVNAIRGNRQVDALGYCGKFPLRRTGVQELVLCVGSPASGKSSFAQKHFKNHGYEWINRDTLGTKEKCIAATRTALAAGKSVIVDNTNPDRESRANFLSIAKQLGVPARCIYFTIPKPMSFHLNSYRAIQTRGVREAVPPVGIHGFYKKFSTPTESEGFVDVATVDFIPQFATDLDRQLFYCRNA